MLNFIAQYWLTFVFGLIAAAATALARKFYVLYKKGKNTVQEEKEQELLKKTETMVEEKYKKVIEIMDGKNRNLANEDGKIFQRLDEQETLLNVLKKGILSIQGRQFKTDCKLLIEQDTPITLEQFTTLQSEHETYNNLGGNHEGDLLFNLVKEKYLSQLQTANDNK